MWLREQSLSNIFKNALKTLLLHSASSSLFAVSSSSWIISGPHSLSWKLRKRTFWPLDLAPIAYLNCLNSRRESAWAAGPLDSTLLLLCLISLESVEPVSHFKVVSSKYLTQK